MEYCAVNWNNHKMKYTPDVFQNIEMFNESIVEEGKQLLEYIKSSTYVTKFQYDAIRQYIWSAHSFLEMYGNSTYNIKINVLEFHKYYAKQIIDEFGYLVPKDFKTAWNAEFASGIKDIEQINMENTNCVDFIEDELYNNADSIF